MRKVPCPEESIITADANLARFETLGLRVQCDQYLRIQTRRHIRRAGSDHHFQRLFQWDPLRQGERGTCGTNRPAHPRRAADQHRNAASNKDATDLAPSRMSQDGLIGVVSQRKPAADQIPGKHRVRLAIGEFDHGADPRIEHGSRVPEIAGVADPKLTTRDLSHESPQQIADPDRRGRLRQRRQTLVFLQL